jgi:1,4-alpha-glucan branching enzyme
VVDDAANSVFAWLRKAPGQAPLAVICNMTPVARAPYRVPVPHDGRWREVLNSDAHDYWGSGLGNLGGVVARGGAALVTLPPLATVMLEWAG